MSTSPQPWVYIVAAWAALLAATVATVRVCNQNAPQSVPHEERSPSAHAR